jgi:hypothetical protein
MTRLLTFLGAVAVHTLLLSRPTVSAQLGRRPTSRSMMTAGARGRPPPPPPPNPCLIYRQLAQVYLARPARWRLPYPRDGRHEHSPRCESYLMIRYDIYL